MTEREKRTVSADLDHFEVFPWNHNFETGHALIDEQHKTLVDLLNKLARTLVNQKITEVNAAFTELANYAEFHFSDEEALWSEYFVEDYWLSSHQMAHAAFLPKVVELKDQGDKVLTDVIEDIVKFLIRWLAFHIIDNDKRMAMAVKSIDSGVSIEEAKILAEKKMSGSMRVLIETILTMYDGLSSSAIELMREKAARIKAEIKLNKANKRLKEISITDQLTGLHNRRHFINISEREIRRARREKKSLMFLLIDIDYFKDYNDNYGHLNGDKALKRIGKELLKICRRPGDYAFRVGGEEFGVLSTGMSSENAKEFGEKLKTSIENIKIPHSYSQVSEYISVSVGLVNMEPSLEMKIEDFYAVADTRLYQAKALGRNRVVTSS